MPLMALAMTSLLMTATPASAATVSLAPLYAGQYAAGGGAAATFLQINSDWKGSTVLWDESTKSYGSGVAIGSLGWGTGLWGLADWQTIQQTAQVPGGAGAPTINFGNAWYNDAYSSTWGQASLLPFFQPSDPLSSFADKNANTYLKQENWTAHFNGYIRVTDAGLYNFSVLNDDGFFLNLRGAGGTTLDIGRDFLNPRERNGFAYDLELSPGLYGFDLGMWNRLEAGVVDLRWKQPGTEWTLVPTTHLVNKIPEPGTTLLLASAFLAAFGTPRRRRVASTQG